MKGLLDRLYERSPVHKMAPEEKILIFSDLHIGAGGRSDDFKRNSLLYLKILEEAYSPGYHLILLGDIEELWEDDLVDILATYPEVFRWHREYYRAGRLHRVVGNHDIFIEENRFLQRTEDKLRELGREDLVPLLPPPSLPSLRLELPQGEIFLFHGHQLDFLNNSLWKISRFFVRYLWKSLQALFRITTSSPARAWKKRASLEGKYYRWAESRRKVIVCAHTHRAAFASRMGKSEGNGEKIAEMPLPLYFNSGCGIYTDGRITAIEIRSGEIALLAFHLEGRHLKTEVLGRERLKNIFSRVLP